MDILVTGFGPFPHVRVNPTTRLAEAVARRLAAAGLNAKALILETSYAGGLPALRAELAEQRPRSVLMLGLAARARFIRVELLARGHASALHPDVSGKVPGADRQRQPALPALTTANPHAALAALRRHGLRSRFSPSAGRYLCDASYATALAATKGTGAPVIFVHVPWLRPEAGIRPQGRVAAFRPDRLRLAEALASFGIALARAGRANHLAGAKRRAAGSLRGAGR
jgi:pyroglutamyl-peptidase